MVQRDTDTGDRRTSAGKGREGKGREVRRHATPHHTKVDAENEASLRGAPEQTKGGTKGGEGLRDPGRTHSGGSRSKRKQDLSGAFITEGLCLSNEINGAHASSIGQVAGEGHNANGPISAAHSVAGCLGWGAPRADGDRPRLTQKTSHTPTSTSWTAASGGLRRPQTPPEAS